MATKLSRAAREANAEAVTLWERYLDNRKQFAALHRQIAKATGLMSWWAAPGLTMVDSDGQILADWWRSREYGGCAPIICTPALKAVRLPRPGAYLMIRPSSYDIEQWFSGAIKFPVAHKERMLLALAEREDEQKQEERKAGMPQLRTAHTSLRIVNYSVRNRLSELAVDRHSPAASAALALWHWAEKDKPRPCSPVVLALLGLTVAHTRGRLRAHVQHVLDHPQSVAGAMKLFRVPYAHRSFLYDTGLRQLPDDAIAPDDAPDPTDLPELRP